MAIIKKKKKTEKKSEDLGLSPEEFFGLTMAMTLAVCIDGEFTDEEQELLIPLLTQLVEGQATEDDVRKTVVQATQLIRKHGFDASVDSLVELLPDTRTQAMALSGVAAMLVCDGESDEETEGAYYNLLVERFEFDEDLGIEIWNEQVDNFSEE